jgi:hypothetical protein
MVRDRLEGGNVRQPLPFHALEALLGPAGRPRVCDDGTNWLPEGFTAVFRHDSNPIKSIARCTTASLRRLRGVLSPAMCETTGRG